MEEKPMPGSIDDLFSVLTQLMTQHASLFETMGQNMFRGFAVILICWYGIKTALSSAGGGPMNGIHFESFGSLLLTIAFGFGMITYYSQPIPGMGLSFYHIIVDQGLNLSNQLNHSLVQEVWDRLNTIYFGMEMPTLSIVLNVMEVIRYSVVILCLIAAATAIFAVIAFGHLLIHFVDAHPAPYDGATILILFFPLVLILLAFTFGVLKIPSLVNSLFTGRSGES